MYKYPVQDSIGAKVIAGVRATLDDKSGDFDSNFTMVRMEILFGFLYVCMYVCMNLYVGYT